MSRKQLYPADFGLGMYKAYKEDIYVSEGLDLDMPIFRYMSLEHLMKTLSSNEMYIPSIQSFTDKREVGQCATIKEVISTISECPSRSNRKRVREQQECVDLIPEQFASCWTHDGPEENYCMWKIHQNKSLVCRIQSSIRNVLDSIRKPKRSILVSAIQYVDLEKIHMRTPSDVFQKSKQYIDEREVRFLVLKEKGDQDHINIEINCEHLISDIILSPFESYRIRKMIHDELISTHSYLCGKIKHPKLIEY